MGWRMEHGESVDPVKTVTRMHLCWIRSLRRGTVWNMGEYGSSEDCNTHATCCVVWLVKRFLQWSVTRPSDDCASGSPRLRRSVESWIAFTSSSSSTSLSAPLLLLLLLLLASLIGRLRLPDVRGSQSKPSSSSLTTENAHNETPQDHHLESWRQRAGLRL